MISPEQQKENERRNRERNNSSVLRDYSLKDTPIKVRTKTKDHNEEPAKVIPFTPKPEDQT